jgi:hypothetical protein
VGHFDQPGFNILNRESLFEKAPKLSYLPATYSKRRHLMQHIMGGIHQCGEEIGRGELYAAPHHHHSVWEEAVGVLLVYDSFVDRM